LSDCLAGLRHLARPDDLIRGQAIQAYERAFAREIGVGYGYSFGAARFGLYGLLRALGVGDGDEVLVQVPTHVVVANAIRYTGARPVFVDCDLDTYNIDLDAAERQVTPRAKALILQHTFGIPVDLEAAQALARRFGLEVIEDCVHALGATYAGRPVGSFGRAAVFSTEETKTISSTMGGMVVTDDPELAARLEDFQARCPWPSVSLTTRYVLKLVLYHLITQPNLHRYSRPVYERLGSWQPLPKPTSPHEQQGLRPPTYERRLSNAQAALALRQLGRLKRNVAHRRTLAAAYQARLAERGVAGPQPPALAAPAYVRYPLWVTNRAAAVARAAPHAVLGTWFTSVLEEAAAAAAIGYTSGSCPRAEAAAAHLVNLPTHPRATTRDVARIVSAVESLASPPQQSPQMSRRPSAATWRPD
jgi:dTDP-4-amino-4,6-dideoxygalactose transaminase